MDRIFDIVANFLSRPAGFFFIHLVMLVGYITLPTDVYTMALSVMAISMAEFILVSQLKGDLALHFKLDKLIKASDAQDDAIAEEKKSLKEIEQDVEKGA
jgi:low affinity Fe/Cu permease